MSWKMRKRSELFDQYAAQLSMYESDAQGLVICPHCGIMLDRRALDQSQQDDRRFTLAHCVPQSVGGKELVLACAKCNSRSGTLFEGDLKKLVKGLRAIRGEGKSELSLSFDGVQGLVPALLESKTGDWRIEIGRSGMNPIQREQVTKALAAMTDGGRWTVHVPVGRAARVQRAVAMAAHLKMYWGFGIEYLGSKSVRGLAPWVAAQVSATVPPIAFTAVPANAVVPANIVLGIRDSAIGPVFMMPVVRPTRDCDWMMVAIPGPTDRAVERFAEFVISDATRGLRWTGEAEVYPMPGPSRFAEPLFYGAMHAIWNDFASAN